jgi:hypothetical protein
MFIQDNDVNVNMLVVIIPSANMLSVIMLNVVILSVDVMPSC